MLIGTRKPIFYGFELDVAPRRRDFKTSKTEHYKKENKSIF